MENKKKLFNILSKVFKIDLELVNLESTSDNIKGWDSLGMVNLIMEIEIAFNVKFDVLEIADLNSIEKIITNLESKNINFK
tara:strand:- start:820 stop:1062 length:243 start_codon:yes stop_codon:yes gene_type:complete